MQQTQSHLSVGAIREALHFVARGDIPSQHKDVLLEVLAQALRDAEALTDRADAARNERLQWESQEERAIETFLKGKTAISWQHADELLMRLAGQLHRNPQDVRNKATELGFGSGVDYRQAKARVPDEG